MLEVLHDGVKIHSTADVSPEAAIGERTAIWNEAQVRAGARVGSDCVIGKGVFIDLEVIVGDRVKLENRASIFRGARLADGVFIGPHSCLLNDKRPRAITPDGRLKSDADWTVSGATVDYGAAIGGGCTVLPGVRIGRFALVGAGSVVTRDVVPHGLVVGNPARLVGFVCECAAKLDERGTCTGCSRPHDLERLR